MAFEIAANLEDVEVGEALLVELAEPVCLVRVDDRDVRAISDTCTHQQQSLSEGTVDGATITCAAHAATFDLDTGAAVGLLRVPPVTRYACRIEDGAVLVDLDHPAGDPER